MGNAEIARKVTEAWNAGDIDGAVSLLHDDCVFDATARVMNPATYTGHDGFRRLVAEVGEAWERFNFDISEVRESGDLVAAVGTSRGKGRGSGIQIEDESAWVFTIRDGLVARAELYLDPAAALATL